MVTTIEREVRQFRERTEDISQQVGNFSRFVVLCFVVCNFTQ